MGRPLSNNPVVRTVRNVLLGREVELEQVRVAVAGRRPVVVHGPAGIGKSAVVRAVANEHGAVRFGQALPALSHRPYHPWLQAMGWTAHSGEPTAVSRSILGDLAPNELIVLEDLQWADSGTFEVLAELAEHAGVLCSVRDGSSAATAVVDLVGSAGGEAVALGPLEDDIVAAILTAQHPELLTGERARVAALAAGSPLLAEMLVESPGYPVRTPASGGHAAIVAALLDRQTTAARLSLFMLGEAPGPLPGSMLDDLDALVDAGLVLPTGDDRYVVASHLYSDPALLPLSEAQRSQAHARLARLEGLSAQVRAEYLLGAGDFAAARREALTAANGPLPRAGQAASLSIAARASAQLPAQSRAMDGADEEHEQLVISAARALNDGTSFAEAAELLGDVGSFGRRTRVAALVEALRSAIGRSDRADASDLIGRAGPWLEGAEGADATLAGGLLRVIAGWTGRPERIEVAGDDPDEGPTEQDRSQAGLLVRLSAPHAGPDELEWWCRIAREEAVSSGALASELDATRNLVMLQIALGRHEEGRALARSAEERAAASGERAWAIEFRTLEVLSRYYDDVDHDEALSWLSYVRTAPVRLETRAMAASIFATMLADRGDVARSGAVLQPWMDLDILDGLAPMPQAVLAWGAAQRAWITGDLAETIRVARWVTRVVPPGYPSIAGTQVVWRWAEHESGLPLTAPEPTGGLLDCASLEAGAITLLHDGEHVRASEQFLAAAEAWRPILWRCTLRSRWAAGHALALAGEHRRAVELLLEVDADLDRSGCSALRPRVNSSLRAAGASTRNVGSRSGSQAPHRGITAQEHRVLLLVAEGLTTSEIARRAGISPSTVDSHVHSAKRKLGVATRIEAASIVGTASI